MEISKISLEQFREEMGLEQNVGLEDALHRTRLVVTPRYPIGYRKTRSKGWRRIGSYDYRAVCTYRDPREESGIPCPSLKTKWRIEKAE